ncbi:MAG: lipid A deacylase LpxR family protein [Chitinophagaceae bacterium]|nr:lipid A deacylase LpxR family protein [Chitinophagaceae bacterium]
MPKRLLFTALMFIVISGSAQTKIFTKELTVVTDNDNYDFELTDRYYSNGFIINYNWLSQKTSAAVSKTINRTEFSHKVYNPIINNYSLDNVLQHMDRPYAGWLSGSYGVTKIYTKQHVLQYNVTVGIMGPGALGEQIQNGWHKLIGLYKVYGWDRQLKNEPGFNLSAEYYHSLSQSAPQKNISVHAVSKATLGNTFTNIAAGMLLKLGWLNQENETGYWSGNLGASSKTFRKNEFIFFLEPLLQYQAYNATVQGGLFRKDKGVFISAIEPIVFQTKTGIMFTGNKFGFRWYYTFRTKEATKMMKGEHWGSIGATLRF